MPLGEPFPGVQGKPTVRLTWSANRRRIFGKGKATILADMQPVLVLRGERVFGQHGSLVEVLLGVHATKQGAILADRTDLVTEAARIPKRRPQPLVVGRAGAGIDRR